VVLNVAFEPRETAVVLYAAPASLPPLDVSWSSHDDEVVLPTNVRPVVLQKLG